MIIKCEVTTEFYFLVRIIMMADIYLGKLKEIGLSHKYTE